VQRVRTPASVGKPGRYQQRQPPPAWKSTPQLESHPRCACVPASWSGRTTGRKCCWPTAAAQMPRQTDHRAAWDLDDLAIVCAATAQWQANPSHARLPLPIIQRGAQITANFKPPRQGTKGEAVLVFLDDNTQVAQQGPNSSKLCLTRPPDSAALPMEDSQSPSCAASISQLSSNLLRRVGTKLYLHQGQAQNPQANNTVQHTPKHDR